MMREINVDFISVREKYESSVQQRLDDLEARGLVSRIAGSIYKINNAGQELINNYELKNKQVEELGPSREELKLEILLRMADYYDGDDFQLLTQDDIITNAVKHQFDIPLNKYFGLVVELLREGFVEKDPSALTDSIRLTTEGYDTSSQGFFEVNLTEEGIPTTPPSTQLTDLQISILEGVKEASETKVGDGFVRINEIWPYNRGMKPIKYDVFTKDLTTPSLQKDLAFLYLEGYLQETNYGGTNDPTNYRYRLSQKGIDFLNDLKSQATTQLSEEDRYMNILKTILVCKIKFGQNPNLAESYKEFRLTNVVPITYEIVDMGNKNPNFLADLSKLNDDGLIEINYDKENSAIYEVTLKGKTMLQNYLEAKGQVNDFISEIEVLSAQSKTQPTPPTTTTHPSYLELQILQIAKEANDKNDFVSEKQLKDKLSNASNKDFQDAIKYLTDSYFLAVADKNKKLYSIPYQGLELLAKNKIESPTTQGLNYRRPSPIFSATKYATGVTMVGNDMSLWRVTENKNGVKRWVKVGGIPSELPDPTNLDLGVLTMDKAGQTYRVSLVKGNKKEWVEVDSIANPIAVETPISEIDEDEVDLDILEQQLNDDSLEFDLTDEDLDNLEF
jgi:DNA-binding PadR family transcriptional regulator